LEYSEQDQYEVLHDSFMMIFPFLLSLSIPIHIDFNNTIKINLLCLKKAFRFGAAFA